MLQIEDDFKQKGKKKKGLPYSLLKVFILGGVFLKLLLVT